MKTERKITMNGAEYIEYLKLRDFQNKKINESMIKIMKTKGFKTTMWVLGILIVLIGILNSLTPHQSVGFNWTWNGILMFLAVCMGLSWLIHGFGFILVRR